jgi:glycerol-3-phosphate dehydrogenase
MAVDSYDLLIIGGGINGTAIARGAAGRGLKVLLVERGDLAQHTSSASSKLIHGGLRYLEQYKFRLVRESLHEREILLRTAPHIVHPLRFILPDPKGGRPWWLIRLGLWTYDRLSGKSSLPPSRGVAPDETIFRVALKAAEGLRLAAYWDAWVDDARLVVLNAVDAGERGAQIETRTALITAQRQADHWQVGLSSGRVVSAQMIVNAAGPWVADVLHQALGRDSKSRVRLIKGSHIVVPRLYAGDHAYILQQPDARVVFAIPYEERFTLLGTTDFPVDAPDDAAISDAEIDYLCAAANAYFDRQVGREDLAWSYSGVRSLHDDGEAEARAVTRDYHLELDSAPGPKLLSVFGGKITTARALAEEALRTLGCGENRWTSAQPLPGGAIADFTQFEQQAAARYPWAEPALLYRLARAYGTRLENVLGSATTPAELGRDFGAGLTEAEIRYMTAHEFAASADDILWRRSKLGLHMTEGERAAVREFVGS